MNYRQGYYPAQDAGQRPRWKVIALIASMAIFWAIALFTAYHGIDTGIVVEKQGQMKPIISEYLLEYGWRVVDNPVSPDPDGWYVLVRNGNTYMNYRLNIGQYDKVEVGAHIVRIGPLVWWVNA